MTENTTASGAADDSLLLCASDLQHSAIYDNPHEMVDCVRAVADRITALAASAPVAPTQPASITLDFKQATELLGMYGGEPTEVTLMVGNGHSGKGVYAHWTSVPEEEAVFLGASNDEAAPVAPAPQPVPVKIVRDFRWDSAQQHHVPTLLLEFEPVPANSPIDAKGWNDRDDVAIMLAAAPKAGHIPEAGKKVEPLQQGEYLSLAVASAPERIWLDLGFDPKETDADFSDLNTPTWSADNASGHGIEYVRADRAARGAAQADTVFQCGKAAGRQEMKEAQQSSDFNTWVHRAYRVPYPATYTIYNMEVAYQAGRESAAQAAQAAQPEGGA